MISNSERRPAFVFRELETHEEIRTIPHWVMEQASREARDYTLQPKGSYLFDHIIEKTTQAANQSIPVVSQEDIAALEQEMDEVNTFIQQYKSQPQLLNAEVEIAKKSIMMTLRDLGVDEKIIDNIRIQPTEIGHGRDVAMVTEHGIALSLPQLGRRALDYVRLVDDKADPRIALQAVIRSHAGHEIGHHIDLELNQASNRIPGEARWNLEGENVAERFAEFWGRVALGNEEIMQKIHAVLKALDVTSVARLRRAFEQTSGSGPSHMTLVFQKIETFFAEQPSILQAIRARRGILTTIAPENYALPFSKTAVSQALNKEE